MTRFDMMQDLAAAGVAVRIEGNALRYRAPRGALTPDLRADPHELKPTLLYEYHERAGILEYDAGFPRAEAEARASQILHGS